MARLDDLILPKLFDREGLKEFAESFDDQAPKIERDIAALRDNPQDAALIASLFRGLHTLKGDAALTRVPIGVDICHPLESLLARCRSGELAFTPSLAELTLLALDRLELALEALADGRGLASLKLPQLIEALKKVSQSPVDEVEAKALAAIEEVTGVPHRGAQEVPLPAQPVGESGSRDLAFFETLALEFERRSPLFAGRSARNLKLALETNTAAGKPVDPTQLTAAIHFHDIGMLFLPESLWLKVGRLSEDERRQMMRHPELAAGLLERMPGWQAAAQMVRQHHEKPDGHGYPAGLKEKEICAGAKILAIVDAFEAITLKHSHRGQNRSLIRAIAEINACEDQFAPEWVAAFNTVVRRMVEGPDH